MEMQQLSQPTITRDVTSYNSLTKRKFVRDLCHKPMPRRTAEDAKMDGGCEL